MRTNTWALGLLLAGCGSTPAAIDAAGASDGSAEVDAAAGGAGSISGTVSGGGDALPGARVTVVKDGFFAEVRTDAAGAYTVPDLADGSYLVGASSRGLEYEEASVAVAGGAATRDFELDPESEPGAWVVIGDSSPEAFGGTNSGVYLPTGAAMFCHDTVDPLVFDPVSGERTFPEQPEGIAGTDASEQGCHNITHLLDGRILYVGGGTIDDNGDFSTAERALDLVKIFDPVAMTWEVAPSLNEPRWYPGLVRLASGELLAFGGGQQNTSFDRLRADTAETLDPGSLTWTPTANHLSKPGGFSPAALLYTGEVLITWDPVQLYDPATRMWRDGTNFVQPMRGDPENWPAPHLPDIGDHPDHSTVVLPDGRVAAIGIYAEAMGSPGAMVEIYDPGAGSWSLGSSPATIKSRPEVVDLPDGRILVAAGKYQAGTPVEENEWGYTRSAVLWDPADDVWRDVAPMTQPREYHAITMLLPDGRVLSTGGPAQPGRNPPVSEATTTIEAFSPPYLYRGPRPRIDDISGTAFHRGGEVTITFSGTAAPTAVVLLGIPAITHFLDAGIPRHLALSFTRTGNQLTARIPAEHAVAMAGFYYLFVMVDDIPSEARIVEIAP